MKTRLTYGMVGAGLDSFIGAVHRVGAGFDGIASLAAGCFSRNETKNKECGEFYRLDADRIYASYAEMAAAEGKRSDKIDYVVISTPNKDHYPAAKAFLENDIHVLCEKPLCFEVEEAEELKKIAEERGLLFCVNYSYSGNNMVKEAREIILSGEIGNVVNVNAVYLQEHRAAELTEENHQAGAISAWRKVPEIAGISCCVGDIGTHIQHTVSYMTGLKLTKVAAKLDSFGQELDMNANMLVEFDNGAHGVFSSSQICFGCANGFVVRIFGDKGSIEWHEEEPNTLIIAKKDQPIQLYRRGDSFLSARSTYLNRLPAGHPEGLYEAFANMFKVWHQAVLKKANGEVLEGYDLDFPSIDDGIAGVKFIHAAVESNRDGSVWKIL